MEDMKPNALKRIQSRLVLEAVAKSENLEASDEDVDAKFEEIAKMYNIEPEKIKENAGDDGIKQMKEDIKVEKAADFVTSNAVEK